MSAQNVRVGVIFSASLRGFSEFKKLGGGMTGLAAATKKVRGELTLLAATMAFDFIKSAVQTFAQFDHSMRKVQAVTGGTTAQLTQLTDEARRLGREFPFTASEAADAMFELSLAGLEVNEVLATTETTLQLAMAGNMGLAQSARIAVATMNAFGYAAEDVAEIGDVLTAGFTNSAMTLAEVGAGLSFVGPVAAMANVSLEESVTVLGLFANAGIAGARSGTTFRQMLSKMLDPTTDAARRMNELGLAFTDANGDLLPMVDILQQLIDAQLTANDVITIFGIRAAPGVGALIQQGVDGFEDLSEAINNSEGELNKVADTMEQSAAIQFKKFTSAMDDFKIAVGGTVMPIITAFIDAFRGEGGMAESLTAVTLALVPLFIGLGNAAAMVLELMLLISPLANLLAENAEIVSLLAEAYILAWLAGKAYVAMLGLKALYAGFVATANVGLASSYAAVWASMWPVVAVLGVLIAAQELELHVLEVLAIALIWYAIYRTLANNATVAGAVAEGALAVAVGIGTAAIWAQNAALAVWNVLAAPLTLTILAVVAAVAALIAIVVYWNEICAGAIWLVNRLIEALAKLANTLSFGLLDLGGSGMLWDDWGSFDVFHSGGMSQGGLAMLEAGETVKSAAAVSEEERQGYTRGGGNTNNINVSGVVDPVAAAGEVVRKLNRQNRLGMGSESW